MASPTSRGAARPVAALGEVGGDGALDAGGLVGRPRCSSSMATDRIAAVGSALPWPGDVGGRAVHRLEHARRGAGPG